MILKRLAEGVRKQDWFTVVVEVLIVVIGIYIGLQVDDWNQARKDRADIAIYLERIQGDLQRDVDFFTYISGEARGKRQALSSLKKMIEAGGPPDETPETIFHLLSISRTVGFEFPEVQTVTFYDLQSSGKLALIEDADLRAQLSFYYQESLHRSDRIESRITGYAAAVFEIIDPRAEIVFQGFGEGEVKPEILDENFDPGEALERFLNAAREERFLRLLTAEQNYTEFMIRQIKLQLEQTAALRKTISGVIGKKDQR